jgi:hypothetical protein
MCQIIVFYLTNQQLILIIMITIRILLISLNNKIKKLKQIIEI